MVLNDISPNIHLYFDLYYSEFILEEISAVKAVKWVDHLKCNGKNIYCIDMQSIYTNEHSTSLKR